jgi:hypothetical protein
MTAPVHRALGALLVIASAALACAGRLEDVVRAQAAGDLSCPESQVTVRRGSAGGYAVTACGRERGYQTACNSLGTCVAFAVGGQAREGVNEDLWADRGAPAAEVAPVEVPAEDSAAGVDALAGVSADALAGLAAEVPADAGAEVPADAGAEVPADAGAEVPADAGAEVPAEVAAEVPAEAKAPVAAGPPGEARPVTLRNDCERTVALFIGEDPAVGAGRYTTLGSMNTATLKLRPGEPVWLLDAKGVGLTSIAALPGVGEIAVVEGCDRFSTR